jgi:hypothetical protein
MKLLRSISSLLLLNLASVTLAAESRVEVVKEPAQIQRRTFDPAKPPPEMPKLKPPEVGVCAFQFGCETQVGVQMPGTAGASVEATVTSVRLLTRLKITVWTPLKASPKIIAHEEAHREICELYYELAESVARRLGESALGEKVRVANPKREGSLEAALDSLQKRLLNGYIRATADRCVFAQERFDAITNHSMNASVSEAEGIARSVSEEKARFASSRPAPRRP